MHKNLDIACEEPTKGSGRELRLVGWDGRFNQADGEVGEDATDGKLNPMSRCDLDFRVSRRRSSRRAGILVTATICITARM